MVMVLAAAGLLWWSSDARHTTLVTASGPPAQAGEARVPVRLGEAWRAASPGTAPTPVARDATVVTADAGAVLGRDANTGEVRWSYRRDLPLCGVSAAFDQVIAVHLKGDRCSQVTTLEWADGERAAQRTGPVEVPTRLVADGNHVAATGQGYLEVWRSDLVRTLAYGRLPTPAQPDTQPRPDCVRGSLALTGTRLALVEHCPEEISARITVQSADPKEPDQPEVEFSTLLPAQDGRVVAVSADRVAVAVPEPSRLLVLDAAGTPVAEHPLDVPDEELVGDPESGVVTVSRTPSGVYWFTGSRLVALDGRTLRPRWTVPGTLGAGVEVQERLLVPVRDGLAVLDVATGAPAGRPIPVDRGGYRGPVGLATAGPVIVEQRGATVVALTSEASR